MYCIAILTDQEQEGQNLSLIHISSRKNRVKLLESIVSAYRFVNDMPEKHHQNLYFLQLQNLSSGYIFSLSLIHIL